MTRFPAKPRKRPDYTAIRRRIMDRYSNVLSYLAGVDTLRVDHTRNQDQIGAHKAMFDHDATIKAKAADLDRIDNLLSCCTVSSSGLDSTIACDDAVTLDKLIALLLERE